MSQRPEQPKLQFIRIDRGISQFNHDYYAVLGLPINAEPSCIRQGYLDIVRILHPDVYGLGLTTTEREIKTQYLAKLVNPAYDALMSEKERNAYQAIYKLLARRLIQRSRDVQIHSAAACELMIYPNDGFYDRSVAEISKVQYQDPQKILEYTAQISELNLVYILHKEGYNYGKSNVPPVLFPMVKPKSSNLAGIHNYYTKPEPKIEQKANPDPYFNYPSASPTGDQDETVIQSRIKVDQTVNDANVIAMRLKQCEIYLSQKSWKIALKELREILQLDPNNSRCLAMLGLLYKNIDQPQMARISLQRSLQINPQEPLALKHIQDFNNLKQSDKNTPNTQNTSNTQNTPNKGNTDPNSKSANKQPIPPPEKRGWLSHLLGWVSPDDPK